MFVPPIPILFPFPSTGPRVIVIPPAMLLHIMPVSLGFPFIPFMGIVMGRIFVSPDLLLLAATVRPVTILSVHSRTYQQSCAEQNYIHVYFHGLPPALGAARQRPLR